MPRKQEANSTQELRFITKQLSLLPEQRMLIFSSLSDKQKGAVLLKVNKHIKQDIISQLDRKAILNILMHLDFDEATDLLKLLPLRRQKRIITDLKGQLKDAASLLLQFDSDTAAKLISLDYIQVENTDRIKSVARQVSVHEKRTGKLPAILVMANGELLGYLPGKNLGIAQADDLSGNFTKKIKTIKYKTSPDQVLQLFQRHPHSKIVVLGESDNVVGIIYSDDIIRLMQDQESASLYDFAGVNDEESVNDSTRKKVRFRYKWLIINLATAFLAAFTVGLFEETINKYVLLAVYMPIVAGMGGNAATQTLAVLVRGISLKQIDLSTMWCALRNELGAGLINGLLNGVLVAITVAVKDKNIAIGIILATAMIINLLIAAFFGTIIPLIMKRLGKDPASSATIFITTATDVFGFLVFLGLAKAFLG